MYEWILVLMGYIDKMVCGELKALKTNRMKCLLYICSNRIREKIRNEESSGPEERIR